MTRDEDLDLLKALRLLALGAVEKKPSDYLLRHIFRWYSREFHTELEKVDDLPLEDVLTNFFECQYERMEDHELEEIRERLLEYREERLAREELEKEAAIEDDEFLRQTIAEAKEKNANADHTRHNLDTKKIEDPVPNIPVSIMGQTMPTTFQDIAAKVDPKLKEIPEGIRMEFAKDGEFDDLDQWDIMGPPEKK